MRPIAGADIAPTAPRASTACATIPAGATLNLYTRQRLGVVALLATLIAVAGTLAFSYAETTAAHAWATNTLEFQAQVTAFRVWVQRGTSEALGSFLGLPPIEAGTLQGDRVRARAELVSIRAFVAGDPDQLARVDELSALLDRRIALEDAAIDAFRASGSEAAAAVLARSDWWRDRQRLQTITSAMIRRAHEDFQRHEAGYARRCSACASRCWPACS